MADTHAYCSKCKQLSAIDGNCNCLWCGTKASKRGGWERPDLSAKGKITDAQLQALHVAHVNGASMNSLAGQIYEKLGYASQKSCLGAICKGFKRLGLPARDRIEATRKASTKHGLAPRYGSRPGYSRYKLEQAGKARPICKATRLNPPRAGEPCQREAMHGSDYCFSHDPSTKGFRQKHLAKVRARQSKREMLPMKPLADHIMQLRDELGSFREIATRYGRSTSLICVYARGLSPSNKRFKPEIGRDTAASLLGNDFARVYPNVKR